MKCPCCNGTGEIELNAPALLTPLQYHLWDALRRAPEGLTTRVLVDRLYGDREDGGPNNDRQCIFNLTHQANKRLAVVGYRIVASRGRYSTYRLERTGRA